MTAAALAVALAQALTPEGTVKKVGKLAGGLVLLLSAVRPLLQLDSAALAFATVDYGLTEAQATNAGEEALKSLIEEKTAAYIAEKGAQMDCQVTACVTAKDDGNGWPTPWSVELSGTWTPAQRTALTAALTAELNIPAQRQSFQESP